MSVGISPYLATGWASTLRNTPFVIPMTAVQLHIGDPGDGGASNLSAVITRMAAAFAAPVETAAGIELITTGAPPSWNMTAAETVSYISVHDALTDGNWLFNARLNSPQTIANGDVFTMGGGIKLIITGVAA